MPKRRVNKVLGSFCCIIYGGHFILCHQVPKWALSYYNVLSAFIPINPVVILRASPSDFITGAENGGQVYFSKGNVLLKKTMGNERLVFFCQCALW